MTIDEPRQRSEDQGPLTRMWDFIDKRDIDKHVVSLAILMGTVKVTQWAMAYASAETDKSGAEVAMVIAAVVAPYMALQAAAIQQYFKARQ